MVIGTVVLLFWFFSSGDFKKELPATDHETQKSRKFKKPEFSKNPNIFKKQSIFSENTGVSSVFSIVLKVFFDFFKFLKILRFEF